MSRFANYTRASASIPRRLLREGKLHLLPVYGLMLTSELAREGIHRSGSFRFADHIYRGRPRGRLGIGYLLDATLLRLPAARSFRNRYLHSRDQIVAEARRIASAVERSIVVVSVPCGIARELVEAADILAAELPRAAERVRLHGIDLDPEPLALSRELAGARANIHLSQGDAFDPRSFPNSVDVIVSTGLADFLADDDATRFYATCRDALRAGGLLVTSSQQPQRFADYLMRELAELRPVYRTAAEVERLLRRAGFGHVETEQDRVGFHTLVRARTVA